MRPFPFWLLLLATAGAIPRGEEVKRPGPSPLTNFVSNLPVIFLETKEAIVSERKVPCLFHTVLPQNAPPAKIVAGLVRIHGASSQGYPKKSFGLTLEAPVVWLGMRESAHWVLNAAFVDRSLMRHKLSYDLFRSLSFSNAPRFAAASRFVEVIVNGHYQGAFLLMERVDRSMLGLRSYDSNALHHACIYKAVDHAANFDRPGHDGYEQREPDPLAREYWQPLDRFNRFVSSAKEADFFHPLNGIAARLDLNNAIDFHLLILLTSNTDGFDKNLILARDAPTTNAPLPRFFFAPWDYDATFGRHWEGSRVGATEWFSNYLFDRLLKDPAYRRKFAARWKQLRERQFSVPNLRGMIDTNAAILGEAVERNASRWRGAVGLYPDRLTFREDVEQMKQWVERRTTWLDGEIERRTSR